MKDFQEIAEKCLNGELFGVFKLSNGRYVASQFLCKSALTKEYYFLDPICRGRRYDKYELCMFSTQFHVVDFIPALDKSSINMKQERNVKLTLEKAKEWYKKGGELREVALQAFNEEELKDSKPRSWEEYCNNYTGKVFYIDKNSTIKGVYGNLLIEADKNTLPSKELAEAFLAMMQLMSLRQAWIGDWEPDWSKETSHKNPKYCIVSTVSEGFSIEKYYNNLMPVLSFPTKEMATDFMDCFKDLLGAAKPLV